jgi:hypothetical protein
LINALGNLGGFFGPYVFGLVRDATGNFTMGLIAIALGPVVSAILVLLLGHDRRLEQIPTRRVATPGSKGRAVVSVKWQVIGSCGWTGGVSAKSGIGRRDPQATASAPRQRGPGRHNR